MRVTQQDIARIAQVSQATVSRVLAGDERVEPDIRGRVMMVVRDHNYKPDVRARSLRSKRTNLIGLVLKREAGGLEGDPFFSMFVAAILDHLAGTPFHLCVDVAPSRTSQEHVYDELLRSRRVDGLILVESETRDERAARLMQDDFPFVIVGRPHDPRLLSVDNDNVLAGETVTNHLLDEGYQRVGFLAGPDDLTVSNDRVEGYRRAVEARGHPTLVWHAEFGFASARDVARTALSGPDRPDALAVMDDYMAMGVVQAVRESRLSIPNDLGLASFNDTNLCSLLNRGLTSMSMNLSIMSRYACDRLLDAIAGDEDCGPKRHIVPCELKVRGSSVRSREE